MSIENEYTNPIRSKLVKELNELESRLDILYLFIESEDFNLISDMQKALLNVQATTMNAYIQCLRERIAILY